MNIILLFITQTIYSLSDLAKKVYGSQTGFSWAMLQNIPFLLALIIPALGLGIQIYVLTKYELSKTMITLGVLNVLFASILGVVFLKEKLTSLNMVGIVCAVIAVALLNIKK